jgi:hypothetical protein
VKVTVRDVESLSTVRPLELVSYLRTNGWRENQTRADAWSTWLKTVDGRDDYEVLVPLSQVRDFTARIADVLSTLERAESRSQIEILNDLNSTSADIIRISTEGRDTGEGTLAVDEAVNLVQKSRDMMLSAACATVESRSYFPPRKFGVALQYLGALRMGQTERGSYVITIHSRVPPELEPNHEVPPPFERRVTQKLVSAVDSIRHAASEAARSGSMAAFRDGVNQGISANLCFAIVGMAGGAETTRRLSLRFSWARSRPAPLLRIDPVVFQVDEIPVIFEAGRVLRESSPVEDFEVEGAVIALDRREGEDVGTITVLGFVEERPKKIRMQLRDDDYRIAIRAHDNRQPVACVGELLQEGRRFKLDQPRQFRILDQVD